MSFVVKKTSVVTGRFGNFFKNIVYMYYRLGRGKIIICLSVIFYIRMNKHQDKYNGRSMRLEHCQNSEVNLPSGYNSWKTHLKKLLKFKVKKRPVGGSAVKYFHMEHLVVNNLTIL